MIATQQLPYHYFQRPDADHLELDSAATSLTGFAGSAILGHRIGRHWNMSSSFNTISPKYEISDLGFQRRADRVDLQQSVSYVETRPGRFRRYQANVTGLVEHNYSWEPISSRLFVNTFVQFLNYWSANLNLSNGFPGTVDDRLTRGGPRAERPPYYSMNAGISSDPRKALVFNFGNFLQAGPGDGSFNAHGIHARKCAHLTPSRNGKAIHRLNARGSHRREILIGEEVRVDVDQTVHHVLNTAAELPFCG